MKAELDGRMMTDRNAAHEHMAQRLGFPAYYGKNLDALYDLLMEYSKPMEILLYHADRMKEQLGVYGSALLHTMQEAENDNINLTVTVL